MPPPIAHLPPSAFHNAGKGKMVRKQTDLKIGVGLGNIYLLKIYLNPDDVQRRDADTTILLHRNLEWNHHSPLTRILIDLSPPHPRSLKEPTENKKKNSKIDTRQVHRCSPYRDDSCEADLSPPRKSRKDLPVSRSDLSPPRRNRNDFPVPSDLSPPRKSRNDLPVSSDLSPPRKIRKESASMTKRRKIGLVTGRNVKEEI
ncbi:hypothetical protein LguiA_015283 [Lonicera macranthoides]